MIEKEKEEALSIKATHLRINATHLVMLLTGLIRDVERQRDTGSKAAGRRARVATYEAEKQFKFFRKYSLAADKE